MSEAHDTPTDAQPDDILNSIKRNPSEPVHLVWVRDGGEVAPRLTLARDAAVDAVLDHYDVEDVPELVEELNVTSRRMEKFRLGIVADLGGRHQFWSDETLLAAVDGISEELAAGFLDACKDIPTLCERRRRSSTALLGELLNDAQVEDQEWAPELEAFIESIDGPRDNLEARLKSAGVWVEPENVTPEGY